MNIRLPWCPRLQRCSLQQYLLWLDSLTATSLTHYDAPNIAQFEVLVRLGYDIVSMFNRSPAFWDNVVVSSSKAERRRLSQKNGNFSFTTDKTPKRTYTSVFRKSPAYRCHTARTLSSRIKFKSVLAGFDRLCGLVVRVSGYRYRGPGFDPRCYQIFWVVVGLERGPLSLVRSNWGATWIKKK